MDETSKWILERLGQRIREQREDLHYSQKHVSDMTGLAINTISKIEHGNNFSMESLVLVCQAINIQPRDLFQEDIPLIPPYPLSPEEDKKRAVSMDLEDLIYRSDYFLEPRQVSEVLREIGQPPSSSKGMSVRLRRLCQDGKLESVALGGRLGYYKKKS